MVDCPCCGMGPANLVNTSFLPGTADPADPTSLVRSSGVSVSVKEGVILSLVFLLLLYSVLAFLHSWKKNYRDIYSNPLYSAQEPDTPTGHTIHCSNSRVRPVNYCLSPFLWPHK